jgi:hypothetical protein
MALLKGLPNRWLFLRNARLLARSFSAAPQAAEEDDDHRITVTVNPYKLHRLDEGPGREVETSKKELMDMFRTMYTMRRQALKRSRFRAMFSPGSRCLASAFGPVCSELLSLLLAC